MCLMTTALLPCAGSPIMPNAFLKPCLFTDFHTPPCQCGICSGIADTIGSLPLMWLTMLTIRYTPLRVSFKPTLP